MQTPSWWQPELTPVSWMIAAIMGTHLGRAVYSADGYGMLTGDQRAAAGLAIMAGFMLLIGIASSVQTLVRERA